ncbi:NAD(P)-dependent oxidoreductase [Paenibacillus nasutitermitis]|uniref:3-hydroxyisobutyrate dehydrogenase n=1 Tax=Paenibacillus nasutitermitis TaxID=1652958 RepID=A0A916YR47_9BACL|nr:NAD(P)-binding domain-containing protein [Paenibacillus nasutitermitis]GGD56867.1 3-hydroxyisobutyrate dehydrogenase [Paenibacillus nasutitermitis]
MSRLSDRDEAITMSNDRSPVTVIGLGLMGKALAAAFLKGSHSTTVWNRSAGKADDLVDLGAVRAETISEAVSASKVVVVCLSTYEVMDELLAPLGNELSGRVLINLTNGTPDDARKTAKWAIDCGVDYLDGAIMAVPQMIGASDALLFYGGQQDLFQAHEPLLKLLGGNTTYLSDDPGVPMLYNLALLTILYGTGEGMLHAQAMLSTANISATQFQPYAAAWFNNVILPLFSSLDAAREVDEGDYATEVSNINTNRLALGHIIKASEELDISAKWLAPNKALLDQMVNDGYGEDSPFRAFETISPVRRNKRS